MGYYRQQCSSYTLITSRIAVLSSGQSVFLPLYGVPVKWRFDQRQSHGREVFRLTKVVAAILDRWLRPIRLVEQPSTSM
jgi:hypothetical protein